MRLLRHSLATALMCAPALAGAQSLLDRPPNMSGDWTGPPGTLHFNFLHRFTNSGEPERKVSNVPTFLVGAGLPKRLFAGLNYSTNSTLAPSFPNEWELFGRWMPLSQDVGHFADVGAQVGYNNAADGADAEVSVARRIGVTRLLVAGRALSNPFERGEAQFAAAGGVAIKLGSYVALTGDVASLTDRGPNEKVAWGAGINLAIPLTPHTLSLQATNTLVSTLQGESRGTDDVRFGFEFTIPLTLRRYFGKRAEPATIAEVPPAVDTVVRVDTVVLSAPPPVTRADPAPAAARDTVRAAPPRTEPAPPAVTRPAPVRTAPAPARTTAPAPTRIVRAVIRNVAYTQTRIEITAGEAIEWTNRDPFPHTVTAIDRSFDSGLIQPNKTYRRTFTKPGTYDFFCTPHPFMKGVVVVKAAP